MKHSLLQHFKAQAVIILLLISGIAILVYVKYQQPSKPETIPAIDYKTVKTVDIVSDTLHLAQVSLFMEINNIPFNKATVLAGSPKFRNTPQEKLAFTSLQFIVPGEKGVHDLTSSTTSLNIREENIVTVYNIVPWTKSDYEKNPPEGRDRRLTWKHTGDYWLKHPPKEMYGMQCYDQGNSKSCLGEILPGEWARVYIDNLPDYVKSPNAWRPFITVSYFTKKYGGLTIKWEAHAKHADKWREIDAKFWQIMHERNLLEAP